MNTIYWLGNDLRLDDNAALRAASESESLCLVYCVDPRWFEENQFQMPALGTHRWQFLQQALKDFDRSVQAMGQRLHIVYEAPEHLLPRLSAQLKATRLVCSRPISQQNIQALAKISRQAPELEIVQYESYTLLSAAQLPFQIEDLPQTCSKFRREAERLTIAPPAESVTQLPTPPSLSETREIEFATIDEDSPRSSLFTGGEAAAKRHLATYLSGDLPLRYKQTRNQLDGWGNSAKLSPWLNLGNISVRRAVQDIREFEEQKGSNESTYWLFVELLWREYFQWLALKLGSDLFALGGASNRQLLTSHNPERFAAWCEGKTPYSLVNACMRELRATGYLSNRGRQIAASCLINELQHDWRYGAAWFQQQLIDYDEGANWGNWQYIAGVGADPRGGRHFNIQKQTELYDEDGRYRRHWNRENNWVQTTVDQANFPVPTNSPSPRSVT